MKRTDNQPSAISQSALFFRCWTLGVGRWAFFLLAILCAWLVSPPSALALTDANPYSAIVGRNTFALKPPAPPAGPLTTPPAPPPNISLQGISTILGRAQALLKVKIAPKPPEPAKEQSLVMDVGQREGDVEVLSIDPITGTVNLSNQGAPLTLNIKDADKPIAGPAIANTVQPIANLPGISPSLPPPPQVVPAAADVGNKPMVPTRPLRTDGAATTGAVAAGAGQTAGAAAPVSMDKVAANVLLYEANRLKNEKLREQGVKLPKMPQHALLKEAPPQ